MYVPLLQVPVTQWDCERCPAVDRTRQPGVHTRFHRCAALGGAEIPMRVHGSGARVRLVEREDYVGREHVQLIGGRPVMAAITDRPDGSNDVAVYTPAATARGDC